MDLMGILFLCIIKRLQIKNNSLKILGIDTKVQVEEMKILYILLFEYSLIEISIDDFYFNY